MDALECSAWYRRAQRSNVNAMKMRIALALGIVVEIVSSLCEAQALTLERIAQACRQRHYRPATLATDPEAALITLRYFTAHITISNVSLKCVVNR